MIRPAGKKLYEILICTAALCLVFSFQALILRQARKYHLTWNWTAESWRGELQTVPIHTPSAEERLFIAADSWFRAMGKKSLDREMFFTGVVGFFNLIRKGELENHSLLTLIDYSLPSTEKRFFVIDLPRRKLLFQSLVAHGEKSGLKSAVHFSNRIDSKQSSLGFFVTNWTYLGQHGYSLRLKGMDPGLNDKAEERLIVIHPADYVSYDFIRQYGWLGRSWGCPALPQEISREIIETIKGGSCVFAFYDRRHLSHSPNLDIRLAVEEFEENWSD